MLHIRQKMPVPKPVATWRNTRAWRRLAGAGAALVTGAMIVAAAPAPSMAAATPVARPAGFRAAVEQIVDDGVPGVAGLARRGGRVVTAASGAADVTTGRPMAPGDRFRVGSITKTMVATVVLQLVAEHRLRLGDSVARWLPGLVPSGQDITVRELLQHTSGLFDYTKDPGFLRAFLADPTRVWQPRALIRIAVTHPPWFPPGTRFRYSNTDYVLLGLIVQAATGQPVGQELADRIFVPLGLRHTSLPFTQVIPPRPYAHGYLLGQPGGPLDITRVSPSWAWAAGAVVSTAADLARFYTALLTGRLLPPPLLHQMLTTVPAGHGVGYGLGILSLPTPCGTAWGHNGAFPGYYSNAFTTRAGGGRQVIVLINANETPLTTRQKTDLAAAVLAGLCGHP